MPCGGPDPQNIPADFPDEKRAYSAERELALCLLKALSAAGERVTFAESCTGGLLSAVFCSVPGASEVYDGGLVSYANSVKHRLLSVEESVLSTFGPVSEQCCAQMAKGACALFSAQLGLAVTGFAGPGGGGNAGKAGGHGLYRRLPQGRAIGETVSFFRRSAGGTKTSGKRRPSSRSGGAFRRIVPRTLRSFGLFRSGKNRKRPFFF